MRTLLGLLTLCLILATTTSWAETPPTPAVTFAATLKEASALHKAGKLQESAEKLALAQGALRTEILTAYAPLMVKSINGWNLANEVPLEETVKKAAESAQMGMGTVLTQNYANGANMVEVSLLMDSPMLAMLTPLLQLNALDPQAAKNNFAAGPYKGMLREENNQLEGMVVISEKVILSAKPVDSSQISRDDMIKLLQGMDYSVIR